MKSVKGTALIALGVTIAIVSVKCGDAIGKCDGVAEMFGWTFLSCALLAIALVLCAFGVNAENECADTERLKKLNRIPAHTNEWRDAK